MLHALAAHVTTGLALVTTPPIDPVVLQQVPDGATAEFNAVLPIAIPVLLLFAGVGIALKLFGKVGLKR